METGKDKRPPGIPEKGLYKTRVIDPVDYDIVNDEEKKKEYFENQKFKEYYESQPENLLSLHNVLSDRGRLDNNLRNEYSSEDTLITKKEIVVQIDSRYRDLAEFPNANRYSIPVNISNVISARIISGIFPNTQLLIKSTPIGLANNKIYWQNQDDTQGGEPYTYVATLTDGNYTAGQLEAEIIGQMNAVRRIGLDSAFHDIVVSINQTTDTTTFESFETSVFADPFSIQTLPGVGESYTDIEVEYAGWESVLSIGDSIVIEGATEVDGISSTFINAEHLIREKVSTDVFIIRVNAIATSLVTGTGGTAVSIKRKLTWKLLWGSKDETVAEVIGFPEVDTPFDVIHLNTQETFKLFDLSGDGVRIKINKVEESTLSNNFTKVITTTDHGLLDGDIIYINSNTDDGSVYDHFRDEVVLTPTEEEDLQRFLSELYNPQGLTVSNAFANEFTIGVPYETIAPIESYIDSSVISSDENGDIILKTINTAIDLSGEQYIMLCCPQLKTTAETDKDFITNNPNPEAEDLFTILQLPGSGSSTVFNSIVPLVKRFNKAAVDLDRLDFSFRTPDGALVDFIEKDHSFIIIMEILETKLKGQDFSSRKNYYR